MKITNDMKIIIEIDALHYNQHFIVIDPLTRHFIFIKYLS